MTVRFDWLKAAVWLAVFLIGAAFWAAVLTILGVIH
jgi:hypothetical protein